jgi:hypothetical protein
MERLARKLRSSVRRNGSRSGPINSDSEQKQSSCNDHKRKERFAETVVIIA